MIKSKVKFAAYIIDSTLASFMRGGSSPSEQNHSSILSFSGKDFTGELKLLLLMLLERHQHKCLLTHEKIVNQCDSQRIIEHHIKQTSTDVNTLTAIKYLSAEGYRLYELLVKKSQKYTYEKEDSGKWYVYRIDDPQSKRYFHNITDRCTCDDVVTNRKQCVHEFALRKRFICAHWSL